jgi:ATP-dependent exoDNAse (exonuclease V) beta subunit
VHRWIQAATEGRITLDGASRRRLRPANERWLREMAVAPGEMPAILERIDSALAGIARDDRGRWLISGPGHAELALTGLVNGRIESVFIDRVRVDDDGTHWIVDYKTSTHEGGDLEAFLGAEAERYRPQLTKYANLYRAYSNAELRCALYFPLLQAFVEVPL